MEVTISHYDANTLNGVGKSVGTFKNIKEAADAIDCTLNKPSYSRFAAWAKSHGYVVTNSAQTAVAMAAEEEGEYEEYPETEAHPVEAETGEGEQNGEGEGEEEEFEAGTEPEPAEGEEGELSEEEAESGEESVNAEAEGEEEGEAEGEEKESEQEQNEEGEQEEDPNMPDPDDPFVKESRLTEVRNDMEQDFFDAFKEHKTYAEQLNKKLTDLELSGSGGLEELKQTVNDTLTGKIAEMQEILENNVTHFVEIKKGRSKKKIEGQHRNMYKLIASIGSDEPAFLVGAAGSGKTHGAQACAESLGLDFYPQSVGAQTTQSHLLGFIDAHGKYQTTAFRLAFENGGLFLLDEIDAGNANTLTILNAALSNGYMSFPDGIVQKHEDFRCVAAANTYGNGADRQYVGRNQLDAATLDRFNFITWDYDEKLELDITPDTHWTMTVQAWRKAIFACKLRHIVSPRASIKGAKLMEAGLSEKDALEMVVFKGLNDGDRKKIKEAYKAPKFPEPETEPQPEPEAVQDEPVSEEIAG